VEKMAIFQNGLKPISIDNIRNASGRINCHTGFSLWRGRQFFQNELKPISIDNIGDASDEYQ